MVIVAFILQSTVISRIPLLGCAPNIILILTFIYGYCDGQIPGMIIGLLGGLLIDVFFCNVLGYNALVLMVIGFLSGIWRTYFYSDDFYIPMIALTCSNILYCMLYYLFWFVLRARFDFGYYFIHIILPEFLMTFIIGVILYKPVSSLIERLRV